MRVSEGEWVRVNEGEGGWARGVARCVHVI